jgi:glycosyltransferase involved in cell wall biosynthesis
MRILLSADPAIPVPPTGYGGIERIADDLVRYYREKGHEVGLVAHPESTAPAHRLFGWPALHPGSVKAIWSNSLALRRAVNAFRPDVLHSFSRLAYLLPILRSRLPKIMSYQRHTGGLSLTIAARVGGNSLSFTGCSDFICTMGRPRGGAWHVIPNFVDPGKYTFVSRVPADAPLVFLSRIESNKGPDLAIAISRACGRRLILAGNRASDGPQREYWDREIAPHLDRDRIEWIGEIDDVRKNDLLGQAAALLVPIQWDEPFGIVFAEALACGTPVLTCRRGALPEIIEPGVTGLFLATRDEGVVAVGRINELDRGECRSVAEKRFSVGVCGAKYLDLCSEAITRAA